MLLFLFATLIFGVPSAYPAMLGTNVSVDDGYSYPLAPNQHTPNKIKEAWLRCHEDKVCQEVDAEVAFPNEKMVVWANVEKEKNYRKLLELLRPLMNSGQIEIHPLHHEIQKWVSQIKTPPPSFWTNSELIEHFQDSVPWEMGVFIQGRPYNTTRLAPSIMYEPRIPMLTWGPRTETPISPLLGQRLLMFAQDTLNHDRKMSQYAANLPALARVAFDPEETPALSLRALAVCREHTQRLQTYEKKLKDNLSLALPSTLRTGRKTTPIEQTTITRATAFDFAVLLARKIQDLSNSVYGFIYPDNQTVTLADLRDPPLIQSLETIQRDTAEFLRFIH
jgi:hypothetical protein